MAATQPTEFMPRRKTRNGEIWFSHAVGPRLVQEHREAIENRANGSRLVEPKKQYRGKQGVFAVLAD